MAEEYNVTMEDAGTRIDKLLSDKFENISRSYIQKLLKAGEIYVDSIAVKSNYKVSNGEIINFSIPEPETYDILPENIPLDILYEDSDIIIVNKPKGMVVHPAPGHLTGTMVNALMYHCRDELSGINGVMRPGIVHRIDKDTTGVIIACKNDFAHNNIAEQLKAHSITRRYRAIVIGSIKDDEGSIDMPIGRSPNDRKKMSVNAKISRNAVTHYKVLERFKKYTYIECSLETGRTHQIRVHMSYIGHPLLGDTVYGPQKQPYSLEGQTLHAMVLGIIHPRTKAYMEFSAALPIYFTELLEKLRQ